MEFLQYVMKVSVHSVSCILSYFLYIYITAVLWLFYLQLFLYHLEKIYTCFA